MALDHKKRIAILGFNRIFSKEHRIRNEIEVFSKNYGIDGYGLESVEGIADFFPVKRPMSLLRRAVILLGGVFPGIRIWFEKMFYRNLASQIIKKQYRFLIPHNIDDAWLAVCSGVSFVFHSHEYLPRQFDGNRLFRFTEIRYRDKALKIILSRAVLTIVEGDAVARQYAKTYGISLDRFIVMPSMPRYRESFHKTYPSMGRINLIHHGLLVPERGIDLLMAIVDALGAGYQLTLMGPGPENYLSLLRERANKAGNINILDPVPYDQIVEKLHGYDLSLVVFGSSHFHHRYMTVPNKFWESLQARVPVLVSPESAMAEYVRKSGCGIVADTATLEGYVAAIRALSRQVIEELKVLCEEKAWIHSRDSWISSYGEKIDLAVDADYQYRFDGRGVKPIPRFCAPRLSR